MTTFAGIESQAPVLAAMAEYDELGPDAFLAKYGFRPARDYVVAHAGKTYDSKAILGVAYGNQFPEEGPLTADRFSGGAETTRVLERLGFAVERVNNGADSSGGLAVALEQILATYGAARANEQFGSQSSIWPRFQEVRRLINRSAPVEQRDTLSVNWSAGQGNWARVPWIALLDGRETKSTRHGIYPVYLFRQDLTGVYLAYAQGVTEPKKAGAAEATRFLQGVAQEVRLQCPELAEQGFSLDGEIDLHADPGLGRDYEISTIAHKFYEAGALPSDGELLDDLEAVLSAYDRYLDTGGSATAQASAEEEEAAAVHLLMRWSLSSEPRTIEFHKAVVDSTGAVWWGKYGNPAGRAALAEHRMTTIRQQLEAGIPTYVFLYRIGEVWRTRLTDLSSERPDAEPDSIPAYYRHRLGEHHLWLKLTDFEQLPADYVETQLSLDDGSTDSESLTKALRNQTALFYVRERTSMPAAARVDFKAIANDFERTVADSGLSFGSRRGLLARSFLAALATKPFVILTGLSGSGKTQLAMKLGEWFGPGRWHLEPVRPDWTGAEALFGYEDALRPAPGGRSAWNVPNPLAFMLRAARDPGNPYVLVLDEMNLAHVERYFADALSGLESRQACLPNLMRESDGSWRVAEEPEPPQLPIPRNLFIAGTVNVDETTYMFSPKVLDRANTLEFRVTTDELTTTASRPVSAQTGSGALVSGFLQIASDDAWHLAHASPVADQVESGLRLLHQLLSEGGFEFGHRVFYEALRFAAILSAAGEAAADVALDLQILQKVLPRLHGSRRRLEPTLNALGKFCFALEFEEGDVRAGTGSFDPLATQETEPRLGLSFEKVQRMTRVLRANQFASFTD